MRTVVFFYRTSGPPDKKSIMDEDWERNESVRLDMHGLDRALLPTGLSVQERERLLQWHGFVISARGNGLFYVEFRNHNHDSGDMVLTVNAQGLRRSWHVGQPARANRRFFNDTMLQMLRNMDINMADIPPRGTADVQGWIVSDLGRSRYAVEVFIPWFATDALFYCNIQAGDVDPIWHIGDLVHIISYVTEGSMQTIRNMRPNVDLEVLRSSVGCIISHADDRNNRYNVFFQYPGEADPIILQIQCRTMRSAEPN